MTDDETQAGAMSDERAGAAEGPHEDALRRLVAHVLRQAGGGEVPDGAYDPVGHVRYVNPGADHGAAAATMVSWHESFHAFLNASTTFGSAMMLAGALAEVGHRGFERLVTRMVDLAVETHEAYATVAGLGAVSQGAIDPALIAGYPGYRRFLSTFLLLFDPARPRISVMALTSCARAAMQTDVYAHLLARRCEQWPALEFEPRMRPDARFRAILERGSVASALAAVDRAIAAHGGVTAPLAQPGRTAAEEAEILSAASLAEQEVVNIAAFEAFARALEEKGFPRPRYDQQKDGLPELLGQVQAFAGPALATEWRVPATERDEAEALFSEFRHEVLVVGDAPIPALFLDGSEMDDEVGDAFVLHAPPTSYLQLVAMPVEKARHLYRPIAPGGPLDRWDQGVVAGFRRYWPGHAGDARVDFLLTGAAGAERIAARHPEAEVLAITSLSVLHDPGWIAEWISERDLITRLLVLIDEDPFQLMQQMERDGGVRLAPATARLGEQVEAGRVEILCMAAEAEPDLLYFTPISAPFRQSLFEVAVRRGTGARVDPSFLEPWIPLLARATPHLLREEGTFGMRFW